MASNNSINNQALNGFTASGGNINISNDAAAATVNVGTGAAVKSTTVGSTNSTSATTVQSGSGALNVTSTNGAMTLNSGTGQINISENAAATTIRIGTAAASKSIVIGSSNTSSFVTMQSGPSGTMTINSNSGPLAVNSGNGQLDISGDSANATVNIATANANKQLTVGSNNSSSKTTIRVGTQPSITLQTGDLTIDGNNATTTLTSSGAALNIASSNGTIIINSGTGSTSISNDGAASSLNLGTGAANKSVLVGSATTGSTTTIRAGTGGIQFTDSFLNLPTTTATAGQIRINNARFMHAYNGATNTFLGSSSGNFTATATDSVGIGQNALTALTSGVNNTIIGSTAGDAITTGFSNTSAGYGSMGAINTGAANTAFGNSALAASTTGNFNVAIGMQSMDTGIATGDGYNTYMGWQSGRNVSTGAENTGVGARSFSSITTGTKNTGIGSNSGRDNTGSNNVALGAETLMLGTSIDNSVAVGFQALRNLGTGDYNCAIGYQAGGSFNGTEASNICINSSGVAADNNTLRIGAGTGTGIQQLNTVVIHGISSITPSNTTLNVPVIDATGQIGTSIPASGTVGLGSDTNANTLNVMTGAAVKTVTIGSTNTSSTTTVQGGTGGIQLSGTFVNIPTTTSTTGQIRMNNTRFIHSYGTNNLYVGKTTGNFTLTGAGNAAFGESCMASLTSGFNNTAVGINAEGAMTTGNDNTAVGIGSSGAITTGGYNTSTGSSSLGQLTTGSYNATFGYNSGVNYTTSESSNVCINNAGTSGDSNTLRIGAATGTAAQQLNATYIHGVRGITTVNNDAVAVLVDSAGQFGTTSSSIRFKENVEDMGDVSSSIYDLRPVTFDFIGKNYSSKQTGLIAEEVFDVMPSLVAHDKDGVIESVKYHELPVLLLNEIKKLKERIEVLEGLQK